jgi:ureidoacrylate peracid hydrolase
MQTNLMAEPQEIPVDFDKSALCVIDMQNYDVKPGGFFDQTGVDFTHGQRVVEPIRAMLETARAAGMPVIFTKNFIPADRKLWPDESSPWFWKTAGYHADFDDPDILRGVGLEDSWGAEIVEELTPRDGDYVVPKRLYSAFQRTDFDLILRRLGVRHLFITGIGTPTCVEATARDAYFHEYFPILIEDCCGAIMPETHEAALFAVKRRYGWVTTSEHVKSAIAESL